MEAILKSEVVSIDLLKENSAGPILGIFLINIASIS